MEEKKAEGVGRGKQAEEEMIYSDLQLPTKSVVLTNIVNVSFNKHSVSQEMLQVNYHFCFIISQKCRAASKL